jgi:membrane-bound lytic murein transglycosylase A
MTAGGGTTRDSGVAAGEERLFRRRFAHAGAAFLLAACATAPATPPEAPVLPPGQPLSITAAGFSDLPGWSAGRHAEALEAFLATCPRLERRGDGDVLGPSYAGTAGPWKRLCREAEGVAPGDARAFFEAELGVLRIASSEGQTGLATAYYEPEIEARRAPIHPYTEPLLRRPEGLEVVGVPTLYADQRGDAREEVFIRRPSGALTLAPPREDIRAAAGPSDAIAYGKLSDVVFLQIQGSGRLRFPDGSRERAAFAATNGRPFTSIARTLADAGEMSIEQASNDRMKAWLDAADPAEADRIVNSNERYVWFASETLGPDPAGPRGAAGAPLTEGASVAIDPRWHVYGTLLWIAPDGEGAPPPRLAVTQDTGGAITGPLRTDLFFGSGDAAGQAAARVRHQARWWALVPRETAEALAAQ